MPRGKWSCAAAGLALLCSLPAQATLGIFEHGNGIKSMGMGGLSYAYGEETTTLSVNPAHAAALGSRYDLGIHVFSPRSRAAFEGNAAGPDEHYRNVGRRYFAIPQGGLSRVLDSRWTAGFTAFAAGLGPDYPDSPYARFGGAQRASLFLNSAGIAAALAYKLDERHAVGASLNLGYQTLAIEGLGFLGQVSSSPDQVSNQGKDASFSVGFTVGWRGQITPELILAAAYRSKSWTEKHRDYRGLLPDGGRLELPAIYGAGVLYTPHPEWTLGFDFQRYQYESEGGFGNPLSRLAPPDRLLGDADGAGFGFANH